MCICFCFYCVFNVPRTTGLYTDCYILPLTCSFPIYERGYKAVAVYGQSKLAMLMFSIELDRRSKANSWGLTSVAAHPGYARTHLVDNGPAVGGNAIST